MYNKVDNLKTFIEEEECDLIFISESWERPSQTLDTVLKLDNYVVISNPHQRRPDKAGGRPALMVNTEKFHVQNLTQSVISIPWMVEIVWCLLTPKNIHNDSIVQKICVAAIYSKPNSRKKQAFTLLKCTV